MNIYVMPPRKRSKRRSSQEGEKMSTQSQARSPEVDELYCVPETGVEELVVGVEDPLQMSDTKQRDKGKGKSSREGQHVSEEKADKRSKKPAVLFSAEEEQKLVDFLHDNKFSKTSV